MLALVGIDGFVVTAQLLDETSGEAWLAVEKLDNRAWRESCAVRAVLRRGDMSDAHMV